MSEKSTLSAFVRVQERAGQAALVTAAVSRLPKEMSNYGNGVTWSTVIERLGIEVLGDYDDLFLNVKLPDGWRIEATDHAMHSDLLDDKGRKRAGIFYKAAFYDRKAHWNLCNRYYCGLAYDTPDGKYVEGKRANSEAVWDSVTGSIVYRANVNAIPTDDDYYAKLNRASDETRAWLGETYPEWRQPFAYWD